MDDALRDHGTIPASVLEAAIKQADQPRALGLVSAASFLPSPNYTPGRTHAVQGICVHIVIGPIKAGLARSLAGPGWFGSTKSGTSAHYIHDPAESIGMVRPGDTAWHCGGGNSRLIGHEFCGYMSTTREEYLSDEGMAMLRLGAAAIAQDCRDYNIPAVRVTPAELKAGKRGICDHNDSRLAFGYTTHTDVGAQFPMDVLIGLVADELDGGGQEMNGEERTWLQGQLNFLGAIITQGREQEHANANENARRLIETLERQTETLAKIAGGVDLLHKDANANARRLNALLAKAGLPDPNYEAQS